MAETRAQRNRAIRKDEIRAYLAERGRLDYVLDNIEKIEKLDVNNDSFQKELLKLKTANEQRIRLLAKYLPDVKDEGETADSSQPITINLVNPNASS